MDVKIIDFPKYVLAECHGQTKDYIKPWPSTIFIMLYDMNNFKMCKSADGNDLDNSNIYRHWPLPCNVIDIICLILQMSIDTITKWDHM